MSRLRPLRIRTRLALWYVICIVPTMLVYAVIMGGFVHHQTLDGIDTRLRLDLTAAVDRHLLLWEKLPLSKSVDWLESADSRQSFVDLWRIDSATTFSLRQRVRGTPVPDLPEPDMEQPDGEPFSKGEWRIVQGRAWSGNTSLLIRAALPIRPLEETMHTVWVGAGLGLLLILAIAIGGGLWIAAAALQPITQLVLRTRNIGPSSLSERLPVTRPADELTELSEVINGLLGRVQAALDRQGRFATEAAHELRTPLTAQRNVGELALRAEANVSELRIAVASMLEEGDHMQKVIDGLLTLARADTGRLVTRVHSVDLGELLAQTVPTLLPLAEERQQFLSWHCPESIHVYADEALLRQVLLNLIHNSINHCGLSTRIEVQVSSTDSEAVASIVDNGPGMELPEVDEVFHRRGTRHAAVRGLGLGLSIARALTRVQGAQLLIESEPGLGTRIHVRLPRVPPAVTPAPPAMQVQSDTMLSRP